MSAGQVLGYVIAQREICGSITVDYSGQVYADVESARAENHDLRAEEFVVAVCEVPA